MSVFRIAPPSLQRTTQRQTLDPEKRLRFFLSYGFDWVLTGGLWIAFAVIDQIDGYRREFSLTDTSLQHTHALKERVPVWLLAVLVGVVPICIMAVISLGLRRSFFDFHSALLGIILAQSITWVATDAFKLTVGRPRPDVIDRCRPAEGSANGAVFGLVTSAICTRTDLLKDGFRSFPSGHASSSFAGLGFLSFYLAAKFHMLDREGHAAPAWIAATPLIGAGLIAITRTMDYRHHATDVIAGGILGLTIAFVCYRLYYPSLTDPECHEPYRSRLLLFSKVEDEEQGTRPSEEVPLRQQQHQQGGYPRDRLTINNSRESV